MHVWRVTHTPKNVDYAQARMHVSYAHPAKHNYGRGLLSQLNFEPRDLLQRKKVSCRQVYCR